MRREQSPSTNFKVSFRQNLDKVININIYLIPMGNSIVGALKCMSGQDQLQSNDFNYTYGRNH